MQTEDRRLKAGGSAAVAAALGVGFKSSTRFEGMGGAYADWESFTGSGHRAVRADNSLGIESGRNLLSNCADKTVDLSIARNIRMGGSRQLTFLLDMFNAFNTVIINGRTTTVQFNSPTSMTINNSQTLPDGSIDPARLTPRTAGFGAATGAQNLRSMQLQIRFQF